MGVSLSPWLSQLVRRAAKQRNMTISAFVRQVLMDRLVGRTEAFWLSIGEDGNPKNGGYIPWSEEVLDMRYRLEMEDLHERMSFWKNLFLLYKEAQRQGKSLIEWMAERGNLRDFLEEEERKLPPEEQVRLALEKARMYQQNLLHEQDEVQVKQKRAKVSERREGNGSQSA